MHTAVELHDSVLSRKAEVRRQNAKVRTERKIGFLTWKLLSIYLASLTCQDGSARLVFAPAYVHRWEDGSGTETGTGWTQQITFTFADAEVSASTELPCGLTDGSLTIGEVLHDNLVPAGGRFAAPYELRLVFSPGAEPLEVRGSHLTILPQGQATFLEKTPFPKPEGSSVEQR